MKTLKQLRENVGLTQKELSEAFGVTTRTIQYLEKDSSNISNNMLKKYINGFDVGYDEIFLGKESEIFVFQTDNKEKWIKKLKQAT